jgi:hypothetical protein
MSAKRMVAGPEVDLVLAALERAPLGAPETEKEARMVTGAKAVGRFARAADVERKLRERR